MVRVKQAGRSPLIRSLLFGAVLAEVALFSVSYLVWHRMNKSRDFRYYMHTSYPRVLKAFYYTSEIGTGDNQIRTRDMKYWEIEGKPL